MAEILFSSYMQIYSFLDHHSKKFATEALQQFGKFFSVLFFFSKIQFVKKNELDSKMSNFYMSYSKHAFWE